MAGNKIFVMAIIMGIILSFSYCMDSNKHADPRGEAFAGSAACIKCHPSISDSILHTAHYKSAAIASATSIAGSFAKDSNTFNVNDSTQIVMEMRSGHPFQVLYIKGREKKALPFDIVFGNAKGQTYLYWKDDHLFQLPVSYFNSLHSWTSSPGYPPDTVILDRPVFARCFECHVSYIKQKAATESTLANTNGFERASLITPIDCERCHGPAAAHVEFQTTHPDQKQAKYMVSYKSLTRTQRMDMCAVCHSGNKNFMLKSTFGFLPGDTLTHFMSPALDNGNAQRLDVHGNQVQLLAMSKCFRMSRMDCSTCHDSHRNNRGQFADYAQRCQSCHSVENHNFCSRVNAQNKEFIKNNCSRCHMPEQASNIIKVKTSLSNNRTPISMVNHLIAVYPQESEKYLPGITRPAATIEPPHGHFSKAAGVKSRS